MANIDDRVVSMSFESTKFQQGVSTSMSALDKFNAALKNIGVDNGLDKIEKSANKIGFSGLGTAIDKIKGKFGRGFPEADQAFSDVEKGAGKVTLGPVASAIDKLKGHFGHGFPEADQAFSGIEKASGKISFSGLQRALSGIGSQFGVLEGTASVALGNITSQAISRGTAFVKSFSFGPIVSGFQEYGTQLNAVQTILANTDGQRVSGLKAVNGALNQLNHYADKTIYNFTEMAKNIGTFTAAGVDLKTAVGSIKGIANLAAISGSNSQQASTAMYQLSQAISAGRVGLQDWNSVVNAGMGGAVFQKALMRTATNMGALSDSAVKVDKATGKATINGESFRNSIMAKPGEQSWLTGDVLTTTLKQLSGDMTDAQLKAKGYSDEQVKAIQHQAKMAVNAATQVKTLSGLLDTVKEAIGSGWSQTWQLVFGNFGEAKTLFTGLSNAIGGMVGANSKARNSLLKTWKDLGGRAFLIDTLKEAFKNLMAILTPIKDAFREIFPKKTAADLLGMTTSFRKLVDAFKIGPEMANNLKRTFAGFFAIFDIGKQILGGFVTLIKTIFSEVGKGTGGFLNFTGNLGDALVSLDKWLKKGKVIQGFFKGLGTVLSVPIDLLSKLGSKISDLFGGLSGVSGDGMSDSLNKVVKAAGPVKKLLLDIFGIWYNLSGLIYAAVAPAVKQVVDVFRDLGHTLAKGVTQNNFDNFFKVLQTTLIGGIFLTLRKAITGGLEVSLTKPLSGVKDVLSSMTGSLKAMQTAIKAHALVQIAIAIALIAASAVALSLVKPEKLASAMTAIGAGFAELLGTMALLSKVGSLSVNAPIIASGFVVMAGAIVVLSAAVVILSRLSWEQLGKGLAGVGVALGILVVGARSLIKIGPGLFSAGAGLTAMAIALNIMAVAMKIFATMKWGEMAKGLAGVAASLAIVSRLGRTMPVGLAGVGAGLGVMAIGLSAMAAPILIFAAMDWATMGKGLLGVGAAMVVISKALLAKGFTLELSRIGAGLILAGIGLTAISGAVALMGSMDLPTLGKGLGALGIALYGLSKGLMAMDKALPGAFALLVASGAFLTAAVAIGILVPTLAILGNMKFTTILKGLGFMSLAIVTLGAVGALAAAPLALLGLGIAGLGLGVLGVGKGVEALAKGVILLGEDGAKGVGILIAAFTAFIAVIPKVIIDFVKGLAGVGEQILKLLPLVAETLTKITIMLIDVLIKATPKVAEAIGKLIMAVVKIVNENSGPLIEAGFKLLLNLLKGIAAHIGEITQTVGIIITRFLTALVGNVPRMIAAGANLLVKFLQGLTNNMDKVVTSAVTTVAKFLTSLAGQMSKLVAAGATLIAKFLVGVANNIGKIVSSAADVIAKFILGIANNLHKVIDAGFTLAGKLITGVAKGILKLINTAVTAVLTFAHGIATALRTRGKEVVSAGFDIATSLIEGVINGLASLPGLLVGKIGDLIKSAVNSLLGDELPQKFQDFFKQHPRLMHGAGFRLASSFGDGMKEGTNKALSDTANAVTNWAPNVTSQFNRTATAVVASFAGNKTLLGIVHAINTSFSSGIKESGAGVTQAFSELTSKINTQITALKQKKKTQQKIVDDMKVTDKGYQAANNLLEKDKATLKSLQRAHDELRLGLVDEKMQLIDLLSAYDTTVKKLDAAKKKLDAIKTALADSFKQFYDQFNTIPEIQFTDADGNPIDPATQLATFSDALKNASAPVTAFSSTLEQLHGLGLNDDLYTFFVNTGVAAQGLADQLLAGGKAAVIALNQSDAGLQMAAAGLAQHVSTNLIETLYPGGVKAASELVAGLTNGMAGEKGKKPLMAEITKLANDIINKLKEKLKIKSPSQEFAKIGKFSMLGLSYGINKSAIIATNSAENVGSDVLEVMRNQMSYVAEALSGEIDANPVITPVLDLSYIQKDAKKLSNLTGTLPITAEASYGQALSIIASQVDLSPSQEAAPAEPKVFQFEQNNYSPKALSEAEIYRQTNNQLSQAKSALGL